MTSNAAPGAGLGADLLFCTAARGGSSDMLRNFQPVQILPVEAKPAPSVPTTSGPTPSGPAPSGPAPSGPAPSGPPPSATGDPSGVLSAVVENSELLITRKTHDDHAPQGQNLSVPAPIPDADSLLPPGPAARPADLMAASSRTGSAEAEPTCCKRTMSESSDTDTQNLRPHYSYAELAALAIRSKGGTAVVSAWQSCCCCPPPSSACHPLAQRSHGLATNAPGLWRAAVVPKSRGNETPATVLFFLVAAVSNSGMLWPRYPLLLLWR